MAHVHESHTSPFTDTIIFCFNLFVYLFFCTAQNTMICTVQSMHQCPHLCISCSVALQCHCYHLRANIFAKSQVQSCIKYEKHDCLITGSPWWQSAASRGTHHSFHFKHLVKKSSSLILKNTTKNKYKTNTGACETSLLMQKPQNAKDKCLNDWPPLKHNTSRFRRQQGKGSECRSHHQPQCDKHHYWLQKPGLR